MDSGSIPDSSTMSDWKWPGLGERVETRHLANMLCVEAMKEYNGSGDIDVEIPTQDKRVNYYID